MRLHVTDPAWRVPADAADSREAGDLRHLSECVRRDHREGQRDHQEIDPCAARGDRAQDQADRRRHHYGDHKCDCRIPAEVKTFRSSARPSFRGEVADDHTCDAEHRRLRKRDHAAVGREEDEARRRDSEQECLDQDLMRPVRAEPDHGPDGDEHERTQSGAALELLLRGPGEWVQPPPLPNRPCGLNASTIAIRMKLKIGEYCVQQSVPAIGRYEPLKSSTKA